LAEGSRDLNEGHGLHAASRLCGPSQPANCWPKSERN